MQPRTVTIDNVKISITIYHETKNETIYFIHGNSSSSRAWDKQVKDPLLNNWRLVTIDLPNHGASDPLPADANYSLIRLGEILAGVIKSIDNKNPYILCGSSLGTNIIGESLINGLAPAGIFLAGPSIIGKGFEVEKMARPDSQAAVLFADGVPPGQVSLYAESAIFLKDEQARQGIIDDYNQVKGTFRGNLFATILKQEYRDQILSIANSAVPVCVAFGEEEQIVNSRYLDDAVFNKWNNKYYFIPGAGHLLNMDAPQHFDRLLAEFVNDVLK